MHILNILQELGCLYAVKNCSEKEKGVLKIRFGFHISTFESAFTFMESWVQKIIVIAVSFRLKEN